LRAPLAGDVRFLENSRHRSRADLWELSFQNAVQADIFPIVGEKIQTGEFFDRRQIRPEYSGRVGFADGLDSDATGVPCPFVRHLKPEFEIGRSFDSR
jgi:hypothetical protein